MGIRFAGWIPVVVVMHICCCELCDNAVYLCDNAAYFQGVLFLLSGSFILSSSKNMDHKVTRT